MRKLFFNLVSLMLVLNLQAQNFDSLRVYEFSKQTGKDSLIQNYKETGTIYIDTLEGCITIIGNHDGQMLRGFAFTKLAPDHYEISVKNTSQVLLSHSRYELIISNDTFTVLTHWKQRLNNFKYRLVFYIHK